MFRITKLIARVMDRNGVVLVPESEWAKAADGVLKAAWESAEFEQWRDIRHEDICAGCSGLGDSAQRIDGRIGETEARKLATIHKHGERAYYDGVGA